MQALCGPDLHGQHAQFLLVGIKLSHFEEISPMYGYVQVVSSGCHAQPSLAILRQTSLKKKKKRQSHSTEFLSNATLKLKIESMSAYLGPSL